MELTIQTKENKQVIDITEELENIVKPDSKILSVWASHTTCAITTADLDTGTDKDLLDAVQNMIPKLDYRHPHDPAHVWTHIASSIIGPGLNIPIKDGKLVIGTWQRIVLIELDGPRERQIYLTNI